MDSKALRVAKMCKIEKVVYFWVIATPNVGFQVVKSPIKPAYYMAGPFDRREDAGNRMMEMLND